MLRNAVPHTQSILLALQPAVAAVSLEQVCYSKTVSARTVVGERGRNENGEIMRKLGYYILTAHSG